MSSSGQTSTQQTGLSSDFSPYLNSYLGAIGNALNLPYQQYPGQMVANLSPMQTNAMSGINSAMFGNSAMNSGEGFLNNTIQNAGNMNNPGLQAVNNTTIQDATRAYNAATSANNNEFNAPGVFGGSRQQVTQDLTDQDFARGLAQGLSNNNYNAYNTSISNALSAVPQANSTYSTLLNGLGSGLQAGGVDQQQNQNLINSMVNQFNASVQYPWTQLNNASGLIGSLMGAAPRTTTTTAPGGDPLAAGLGTLALSNYLGKSGK